jgi:hypothetical protein
MTKKIPPIGNVMAPAAFVIPADTLVAEVPVQGTTEPDVITGSFENTAQLRNPGTSVPVGVIKLAAVIVPPTVKLPPIEALFVTVKEQQRQHFLPFVTSTISSSRKQSGAATATGAYAAVSAQSKRKFFLNIHGPFFVKGVYIFSKIQSPFSKINRFFCVAIVYAKKLRNVA